MTLYVRDWIPEASEAVNLEMKLTVAPDEFVPCAVISVQETEGAMMS